MTVKLLTEEHLEFLSLKGDCKGSSESIHVKKPHCWKSHVAAHMVFPCTFRVSSVLNRDVKQFGKKFLLDGQDDTCWNSDQV